MLDHTNDKIPLCLLTSRKTTLFIEDASIYVIEKYGWFLMVPGRGRLDYLDLARPRGTVVRKLIFCAETTLDALKCNKMLDKLNILPAFCF